MVCVLFLADLFGWFVNNNEIIAVNEAIISLLLLYVYGFATGDLIVKSVQLILSVARV